MEAAAEDELTADERLLARMDQGLYSLQQCALIVGHLWFVGDLGVRKRLLQLLHQKVRFSTSTQYQGISRQQCCLPFCKHGAV